MKAEVEWIWFVEGPEQSAVFYRQVLDKPPRLFSPAMVEFELQPGCVLGLMRKSGIRRLLSLADRENRPTFPEAELYLLRPDARALCHRALLAGGTSLSEFVLRDWSYTVAYVRDPDGHLVASAENG